MTSVHTLVDVHPRPPPPPPPHYAPLQKAPPPSFRPSSAEDYTFINRGDPEQDEDVDIDDEDDLEDEDEEDEEEGGGEGRGGVIFHIQKPPATPSARPPSAPSSLPSVQGNNAASFLSINHIISPTNTPQQSPPKKRDPPQPLNPPSSANTPVRSPTPTPTSSDHATPSFSQGNNSVKKESPDAPLDLLKENRHLRKKVEGLMSHNMQLMLGVKERDHKITKQKRLLIKYRKALLRFFEENETGSSSDGEELSSLSGAEYNQKSSFRKDAKFDNHVRGINNLPTSINPTASTTSASTSASASVSANNSTIVHIRSASPTSPPPSPPPSSIPSPSFHDDEKDDDSVGDYEFDISKKRKGGPGDLGDLEPDKKRRGPRRNALWTPEDDEMFQKIYNVYGKSWKTIHNYMPGKTREQVQSHGQYLIRIGKLEDIKTGPRRGRKSKKDKESPQQHHTISHSPSHHSSHSHSSHSPLPPSSHSHSTHSTHASSHSSTSHSPHPSHHSSSSHSPLPSQSPLPPHSQHYHQSYDESPLGM